MSNLSGTDKSVILLMTIGEDRAAEVFKHLSTREVQALSTAMANVRQISNKQLTDVLSEFEQEAEQFAALNINANEYLRSVLVKALGEERASSLLEDILETRDTTSGIETLNFMEPQSAADLIATSTRRLSPPFWSTSNAVRPPIFWRCLTNDCVMM